MPIENIGIEYVDTSPLSPEFLKRMSPDKAVELKIKRANALYRHPALAKGLINQDGKNLVKQVLKRSRKMKDRSYTDLTENKVAGISIPNLWIFNEYLKKDFSENSTWALREQGKRGSPDGNNIELAMQPRHFKELVDKGIDTEEGRRAKLAELAVEDFKRDTQYVVESTIYSHFIRAFHHHEEVMGILRETVTNIVVFGLSDLLPDGVTGDHVIFQSLLQHQAVLAFRELLLLGQPPEREIPIYLSNPNYTNADSEIAAELGMKVVKSGFNEHEGITKLDEGSFVFDLTICEKWKKCSRCLTGLRPEWQVFDECSTCDEKSDVSDESDESDDESDEVDESDVSMSDVSDEDEGDDDDESALIDEGYQSALIDESEEGDDESDVSMSDVSDDESASPLIFEPPPIDESEEGDDDSTHVYDPAVIDLMEKYECPKCHGYQSHDPTSKLIFEVTRPAGILSHLCMSYLLEQKLEDMHVNYKGKDYRIPGFSNEDGTYTKEQFRIDYYHYDINLDDLDIGYGKECRSDGAQFYSHFGEIPWVSVRGYNTVQDFYFDGDDQEILRRLKPKFLEGKTAEEKENLIVKYLNRITTVMPGPVEDETSAAGRAWARSARELGSSVRTDKVKWNWVRTVLQRYPPDETSIRNKTRANKKSELPEGGDEEGMGESLMTKEIFEMKDPKKKAQELAMLGKTHFFQSTEIVLASDILDQIKKALTDREEFLKGVTNIIALGGSDLIPMNGCPIGDMRNRLIQHRILMKIHEVLLGLSDKKKDQVPIYLQDPNYMEEDKEVAKLLEMEVLEGGFNKHQAFTKLNEGSFVVDLPGRREVPSLANVVFGITRPAAFLSGFPLDFKYFTKREPAFRATIEDEIFFVPGQLALADEYAFKQFQRDYEEVPINLGNLTIGSGDTIHADGYNGKTHLGDAPHVYFLRKRKNA